MQLLDSPEMPLVYCSRKILKMLKEMWNSTAPNTTQLGTQDFECTRVVSNNSYNGFTNRAYWSLLTKKKLQI